MPALQEKHGYKNPHQVPKVDKVVVNTSIGSQTDVKAALDDAKAELALITGQKPLTRLAKIARGHEPRVRTMQLQHRQDLFDLNHFVYAVSDHAFNRGAQLGEIARPRQSAEQRQGRLSESSRRPATSRAALRQQTQRERRHIVGAIA